MNYDAGRILFAPVLLERQKTCACCGVVHDHSTPMACEHLGGIWFNCPCGSTLLGREGGSAAAPQKSSTGTGRQMEGQAVRLSS